MAQIRDECLKVDAHYSTNEFINFGTRTAPAHASLSPLRSTPRHHVHIEMTLIDE